MSEKIDSIAKNRTKPKVRRNLPIRYKVMIPTVLITVLFGTLAAFIVYRISLEQLKESETISVEIITSKHAGEIEQTVNVGKSSLETLKTNATLLQYIANENFETTDLQEFLENRRLKNYFASITIVDQEGNYLATAGKGLTEQNTDQSDTLKEELKAQESTVLFNQVGNNSFYYTFVEPIPKQNDNQYFLIAKTLTNITNCSLTTYHTKDYLEIHLVDSHGRIICSTDGDRISNIITSKSVIELIKSDVFVSSYREFSREDEQEKLYVVERVEETLLYVVSEAALDKLISGTAANTRLIVFVVGMASIGAMMSISLFMSRFLSPLKKLRDVAEDMAKKDDFTKVELSTHDELQDLSESLNELVSKLFESRKSVQKKVEEQTREIEKQKEELAKALKATKEQKEYSERAAEELMKYKLATDNVSELIIITSPEGRILYTNKAIEDMTGFTMEEVIGKKAGGRDLWGGNMPAKIYEDLWDTIAHRKKPYAGEFNNRRKNGENYIAGITISPVLNRDGIVMYYVGVERDITKEKEIDAMKTEFISLASHQLRTPLSAIKWFLEMLINGDAGKLNKEQAEFVENINQSNERMIELVSALLNVSRIESGRIIVEPIPTNMKKLVEQVIGEVENKAISRKQKLDIHIDENIPMMNIDPKLIRNVYLNLLTNAIKYTPPEGSIFVSVKVEGEELLTEIKDSGYGIPEKEKGKVFQKFFRAENVVSQVTDGTGLGLYLVKTIIDTAKGNIWFESQEGKGTTFWFALPLSGMEPKEGVVTIES